MDSGFARFRSRPGMTVCVVFEASSKPRLHCEVDRLCPLTGFNLLAVGGLHAGDLEAPIGADHGEAVGFDRDDLANERAREAEHWRIRTRLGDPERVCQAMAVEGRTLYPDLLVVICR